MKTNPLKESIITMPTIAIGIASPVFAVPELLREPTEEPLEVLVLLPPVLLSSSSSSADGSC
jgi:hypothetical protein